MDFIFDKADEIAAKEQLKAFCAEVTIDIQEIKDLIAKKKAKYSLDSRIKHSQILDVLVRLNNNAMHSVENHYRTLKLERENIRLLDRYKAEKAEEQAKKERAVIYCHSKGLTLGADFSLENAIEKADEVAFDSCLDAAINSGEPVDFSGKYCNCEGWTPSREWNRCQCGDHRVGYSSANGFDFENQHNFYASTY